VVVEVGVVEDEVVVEVEVVVDVVGVVDELVTGTFVDDNATTCSVVVAVLFPVSESRLGVVAFAMTVYVPGTVGAETVVTTAADWPGISVPSEILSNSVDAIEIVTVTELALPLPRLVTMRFNGVVAPLLTLTLPSFSEVGTRSDFGPALASVGIDNRAAIRLTADKADATRSDFKNVSKDPSSLLSPEEVGPLFFGSPAIRNPLTRGFASPPHDGFALLGKGCGWAEEERKSPAKPRCSTLPISIRHDKFASSDRSRARRLPVGIPQRVP